MVKVLLVLSFALSGAALTFAAYAATRPQVSPLCQDAITRRQALLAPVNPGSGSAAFAIYRAEVQRIERERATADADIAKYCR